MDQDNRRFWPVDLYAGMNRQQRRQAQKAARRGIDRSERVVPLPALLDEFTIFDIPQTILDRIEAGEIEAANGVPIFRDNTGEWNEVCPALSGWIFTWQRISDAMAMQLDLAPLRKLNNKLQYDMKISEQEIEASQVALNKIRHAFRAGDRSRIAELARDAQIAILTDQHRHNGGMRCG